MANEESRPPNGHGIGVQVLTVEEWAEAMRISRGAAYAAVRNGDVKSIRIGRLIRIPNPATPAAA